MKSLLISEDRWGPRGVIFLGLGVRVFLIFFSFFQDAYFKVKFTDIDYQVYSDAALHVLRGESAFERQTYRYTPLIAYLLVPNHVAFGAFGKAVFSNADILISILHLKLLECWESREPESSFRRSRHLVSALALWLFNPYTATISCRGSSDSISSLCLMLMLLRVQARKYGSAGFWFGLAVHIRIFPIIYVLPLLLHLGHPPERRLSIQKGTMKMKMLTSLLSRTTVVFFLSAACTCIGLCAVFYKTDGQRYLDEAIMYHFGRFDLAHNFSPWFFIFRIVGDIRVRRLLGLAAFLPQLVCCVYYGLVRRSSLPFKLFMVTLSFVTLNKVVTAQYFAWYLVLLPLVYRELTITPALKKSALLWVLSQLNWLFWAYLYEFERIENVLALVFFSSVVFLISNIYCMLQIDKAYSLSRADSV